MVKGHLVESLKMGYLLLHQRANAPEETNGLHKKEQTGLKYSRTIETASAHGVMKESLKSSLAVTRLVISKKRLHAYQSGAAI
jgi:hypothetical protein